VAAAALFYLTGESKYRADADKWHDPSAFTFFNNWNNAQVQGLSIMADAPDVPGAIRSRTHYRSQLRAAVKYYSDCSNDGQAGTFCKCVAFIVQQALVTWNCSSEISVIRARRKKAM
jgi:hypothetical protein